MFTTQYGNFDGNGWENMMQIIFKKKFMSGKYRKVKASPGDFGIEGFTKDGMAFQCYCPDVNTDNNTLYEKQRDKITTDINKLKANEKDLGEILGGVILKSWILVTPRSGHRDILIHCNKKRELVKSWKLPFIDNDNFDVLVHEGDDYALDIGEYFSVSGKKFSISPMVDDIKKEKIIEWKNSENDLVKNAFNKNEIRINSVPGLKGNVIKTNELTDETAKNFLNGESILRIWNSTQPENHQRFVELLASVEDELKEKCMLNVVVPNEFVNLVAGYMEEKLKEAFTYLDESTIIRLKNYAVAFWLLRCPLYFEISESV